MKEKKKAEGYGMDGEAYGAEMSFFDGMRAPEASDLSGGETDMPQCKGDPGECAFNGACMYACGRRPHDIYKTGDKDAPDCILDRNGEVILTLCRQCGMCERELSDHPHCRSLPSDAASQLLAEPSADDVQLAEMILSDCGCSTANTRLLDRVTDRIAKHRQSKVKHSMELSDYPSLDADVEDESGLLMYFSREAVVEAIEADRAARKGNK